MQHIQFESRELPYAVNEELKTLRTNLLLCGDDKRVIMLTSCVGGEGKSTLSLNLARALCELGKSVFFIDCDLRKSVLAEKVVEGTVESGLTHYLAGRCRLEDATYAVPGAKLTVIPAGTTPPNPSELLSSERMTRLLADARSTFDYVLLDCAPLGMVVDAAVLAPQCDGAILVVEAGTISYRYAQDVVAKLRNTQCPVLGVVLNKVDRTKSGYYSQYGKYGKYGKYNRYDGYGKKATTARK